MSVLVFATFAALVVFVWQLFVLAMHGRRLAAMRPLERPERHINLHARKVWHAICTALIAVVLVEIQVRLASHPYAVTKWLLYVHFSIVALVVTLCTAIVWKFNGLKRRDVHGALAYTLISLTAAALVTGSILYFQMH